MQSGSEVVRDFRFGEGGELLLVMIEEVRGEVEFFVIDHCFSLDEDGEEFMNDGSQGSSGDMLIDEGELIIPQELR